MFAAWRLIGCSFLLFTACTDYVNPYAPLPPSDITITIATEPDPVSERESVTLSAVAEGGTAPYIFRWNLNAGPEDIELSAETGPTIVAGPFEIPGQYTFRVVATDVDGATAVSYVTLEVEPGLSVSLTVDPDEVLEGSTVELTAAISNGTEPFEITWELEDGPVELDLSTVTEDSFATEPLTAPGTYTFSVTVEDADGFMATAMTSVTVNSGIELEVPNLVLAGVPAGLSVTADPTIPSPTFLWEVIAGTATFNDATLSAPLLTATTGETLTVRVTVSFDEGTTIQLTREAEIVAAEDETPRVLIATNLGDFVLELDTVAAPNTTANFLAYVDEGFYDGVLFHRAVCTEAPTGPCDPFVIQGGGYVRDGDDLEEKEPTRDPIESEAPNGLTNGTLYTVAMALSGGDENSAQAQFFVNLDDNSFLDEQGFTVFGIVVEGRDVVDGIVLTPVTDNPFVPGEVSLPVDDVIMTTVRRAL